MGKTIHIFTIYKIVNIKTNKIYVGSTSNFKRRKRQHLLHLKQNKHHSIKLQRSYNKHGKENFIFEIIQDNIPEEHVTAFENLWIKSYNSYTNGYNSQRLAGKHSYSYGIRPASTGKPSPKRKKILSYNLQTGTVEYFNCIDDAKIKYGSYPSMLKNINLVHSFQHLWFYNKGFNLQQFIEKYKKYINFYDANKLIRTGSKICSYDLTSGSVEYFSSAREPMNKYGFSSSYKECLLDQGYIKLQSYNRLWFYTKDFCIQKLKYKYLKYANHIIDRSRKDFSNCPKIVSYDLNTGKIEKFKYLTEPMKKHGYSGSYRQCLSGKCKKAYDKLWFYEDDFNLNSFIKSYKRLNLKLIRRISKKSILKQEELSSSKSICKVCNNIMNTHHSEKNRSGKIMYRKRKRTACSTKCAAILRHINKKDKNIISLFIP
jgi:group I intron endonuclease